MLAFSVKSLTCCGMWSHLGMLFYLVFVGCALLWPLNLQWWNCSVSLVHSAAGSMPSEGCSLPSVRWPKSCRILGKVTLSLHHRLNLKWFLWSGRNMSFLWGLQFLLLPVCTCAIWLLFYLINGCFSSFCIFYIFFTLNFVVLATMIKIFWSFSLTYRTSLSESGSVSVEFFFFFFTFWSFSCSECRLRQ